MAVPTLGGDPQPLVSVAALVGLDPLGTSTEPLRGARVLVVEDEVSIAEPFASALGRNGFDPVVATTAAAALELARNGPPPAVILLDLTLPDGDGRDVCRELRRHSDVPIIIISARGTEIDRVVGLELGADDYVVKPFTIAEVIARIRAVLRRSAVRGLPPDRIVIRGLALDLGARRAWIAGAEVELTRKEFDLLERLVRDAGRVVSRETLMSEVWDENWFGSTKTLDVHIASLRRKLDDDPSAPRYIHTVRGVGFRFAGTEEPSR